MMNVLDQAEQAYAAGDTAQSLERCLQILAHRPDHIQALNLLCAIAIETKQYDIAIERLRAGIAVTHDANALRLNLANLMQAQGDFKAALREIAMLIHAAPDYAAAYNNLGSILYKQQDYHAAKQAFITAIRYQAHYPDAYYNLGLCCIRLNELRAAEQSFQAILAVDADHLAARFQLAAVYMQQEKYTDAIPLLQHIVEQTPHHFESLMNLASCYLEGKAWILSEHYYQAALRVQPTDIQANFNLAVIAERQQNYQLARARYQHVLQLYPASVPALVNLGYCYLKLNDRSQAIQLFKQALAQDPDQPAVRFTLQALCGDGAQEAPIAYVERLFDQYADRYEHSMQHDLAYQVPQQFITMFQSIELTDNIPVLLDLGCGTGLCGQAFATQAHYMVGVDASKEMLNLAREKNIYAELHCENMLDFLAECLLQPSVIIAGDVFVYCGDLSKIFAHCARLLVPNGYVLFNVETAAVQDVCLSKYGRFQHATPYVQQLAIQSGFEILQLKADSIRQQAGVTVGGTYFLLKKRPWSASGHMC